MVRIVMESENMDSSDPQKLIEAGIPIVGDQREGLMHDKYMVIDRSDVWTGSMNFTDSGVYADNNNFIRIHSPQIAENYTHDFEEMFVKGSFGDEKGASTTPNPIVRVEATRIDSYFSPDGGTAQRITELLKNASESIHFLAYSFTNDDFGQALVQKAKSGLAVSGVMEQEQARSNLGTEYDPLRQAGIDVRLDGNSGLMHHKVFIIDGKVVILGSYNFSNSAEKNNDENVLIIFSPQLAQLYLQEFQRVYNRAQSP